MKYLNIISTAGGNVLPVQALAQIVYEVNDPEEADELVEKWRNNICNGYQGEKYISIDFVGAATVYSGGDTTKRIHLFIRPRVRSVEFEEIERYFINGVMEKGESHE